MNPHSSDIPASIELWNTKLNIHGEFLAIASIACFGAPKLFDFALLCGVVLIFAMRVAADAKTFPESLYDLRRRAKDGTISEQQREWMNAIDARFFGWLVVRRQLPIYFTALGILVLTVVGLALRSLNLLPS